MYKLKNISMAYMQYGKGQVYICITHITRKKAHLNYKIYMYILFIITEVNSTDPDL